MKLHAARPTGLNTFTGYGERHVLVNGERHESSVVVLGDRIVEWGAKSFESLARPDFEMLAGLGADIVILGTGPKQRFPRAPLTAPLAHARIGLEVMDTQAACRTYNILVAENRKVAAALLFE